MGAAALIHGACGVIVFAFALGLYRSTLRPAGLEAQLARVPILVHIAIVAMLSALLCVSLGLALPGVSVLHSMIDFIGLTIHEAGHFYLSWSGRYLHTFGGTLFEVGVPAALAAWCFCRHHRRLAALFLAWCSIAIFSVAAYAGDAQALDRPLLGGMGSKELNAEIHDWHVMLRALGWLEQTRRVADFFWSVGLVTGAFASALYTWTLRSSAPSEVSPGSGLD